MNDKVKSILLVAALGLGIVNTYFIIQLQSKSSKPVNAQANNTEVQNNAVAQNNNNNLNSPTPIESGQNISVGQNMRNPPDNSAPAAPTGPKTSISFSKSDHDFGTVKQESENKYEFEFTNAGSNPLVISDAKGSCGCTVPEYPKEPIAPGKKAKIKVVYSPGKQAGSQTKNVTVTANTDPPQTVLTIRANVVETK